jgi:hypothetical protein
MAQYESIIDEIPEDDFTNVLITCYKVCAKSLSYWKRPVIFTNYGEADFYFKDLIKSKISDEIITQAWIEEYVSGYWNVGGMEIKTYDHGTITC